MPTFGYYMADLSRTKTASHGIINYSLGLLSELVRLLNPEERLVVFGSEAMKAEFDALLSSSDQMEWHATTASRSTAHRLLADHVLSLQWARRAGVDVLHFPKGFVPLWHPPSLRVVATIHDDIPVRYASGHFGDDYKSWTARYFAMQIKHSLRRADRVLAVSDFTRSRLQSLQSRNPASIEVTFEGVLNLVTGHERIWPKKRQLLIMGSIHPHKRTEATVDFALRYLAERSNDLELLVLGSIPPEVETKLAGVAEVSRESRLLDSPELIDIMAESAALLFGSSYEGFGLPPLEAALLCTPVVYSNCAAVNEVMEGTHFPFNDDYDEFAAALDAALAATESELATAAETLGDKYDWTKIGERTLQAYRSLL